MDSITLSRHADGSVRKLNLEDLNPDGRYGPEELSELAAFYREVGLQDVLVQPVTEEQSDA